MVIWKEPLIARQYRIKEFSGFQFKNLLKGFLYISLLTIIMMVSTIVYSPARITNLVGFRLGVGYFVFIHIIFYGTSLFSLMANYFEATYSLNEQGLRVKRSRFTRFSPWWQMPRIEIVPHPVLEDIFLIRIMNGPLRPIFPPALRKIALVENLIESTDRVHDEIPFELGQIDPAAVLELYEKYGQKKKSETGNSSVSGDSM